MTKSTTVVGPLSLENQRGKVGVKIQLSYDEFGDPFADSVKSDCEEFLAELRGKYMREDEERTRGAE